MMQTKFVRAEIKYKPKLNLSDSRTTFGRYLWYLLLDKIMNER